MGREGKSLTVICNQVAGGSSNNGICLIRYTALFPGLSVSLLPVPPIKEKLAAAASLVYTIS